MKTLKKISLLFLFFHCNYLFSFDKEIKRTSTDIIAQKEIKMKSYHLITGLEEAITLPMPYGEPDIISETDKKKIKESEILRVDLVFSDFPKGEDLKKLNTKRIKEVEKLRASIISNPDIPWRIIRQTMCENEAEAKTLFHGIVIHLRSKQDKESTKRDFSFLDLYLIHDSVGKKIALPDSTLFKVFKRNEKWNDMLIVADLTGSMAPYTAQLVLWFKLINKDKKVKDFVFFNDGDDKVDAEKIIGKTGGIYHSKAKSYEEIVALAKKTMLAGCGGDGPENDIEALLKGIEINPNAKEIILIADNLANVKDFSLLEKLNKPIRIILCGPRISINPQYLEIARKTGGSVHTMEEDLVDLMKKNEGEKIVFDKRTFQIVKGKFVEIKKI